MRKIEFEHIELSDTGKAHLSRTELSTLVGFLRLLPLKCDVHALAIKLLSMYGSFANVMYAGESAAEIIPELTKPAGTALSLLPNVVACCENTNQIRFKEGYFKSLLPFFLNAMNEECKIIAFDKNNEITEIHHLAGGSDTDVTFELKTVENLFKEMGDDRCIFVHNHPGGTLCPSEEDIITFEKLHELAAENGVKLVDCVIFTLRGTYSDANKQDYPLTHNFNDEIAARRARLIRMMP